MRALLIVNPRATSTTPLRRDVITRALASELDLEVVQTRYRGHAAQFAGQAAESGFDLVLTLGGDGTVNEAVNGLLHAIPPAGVAGAPGAAGAPGTPGGGGADTRPALAALPGGSANVFIRALGIPPDPIDATGRVLAALIEGRSRHIGVGLAQDRYFTFNAGLGFDAEVVRAMEGLRADGQTATAGLYLWTAIRHFYGVTNRRQPALTMERDGLPEIGHLFFAFISNAAPWTYLGRRPVNPSPEAGFDTGLDVFAVRTLSTLPTLNTLRQMLGVGEHRIPASRSIVSLHDQKTVAFRAARPIAFQVDGEYVGEREHVTFQSVPDVLRVIA
ncbi:MAG TPA: diacylglycerol kinase family protein [Streptosporangiaceae bacterium]|nr:diacylglycerol kinase family protein [Streptosporangiaceae bacterium]